MDLPSLLFIFSPMKENKKFTNIFARNISELAACRDERNFPNIAANTVELTETANEFSHSLRGLIHRCKI